MFISGTWHQRRMPAICLNYLPNWDFYGTLNPRVLDLSPIRTLPYRFEVARELHSTKVTERRGLTLPPNG